MTIGHISDTHLGYRAYGKTGANGFNQREIDVMRVFKACLSSMAERDPDVVIHSGDVFDVVRPSNAVIIEAFKAISDFQAKRKGRPFIVIGGNHDSPRLADSGNILKLFASIPGVEVVTSQPQGLEFPDLDLEVLCLPSNSMRSEDRVEWAPMRGCKYSILMLHGIAAKLLPDKFHFEIEDTRPESWTYVGMGDYHMHTAYGPNACYAGSTDFTSNNIWEEIAQPKGWVWFDTTIGVLEHVAIQTRPVIDLPPIDARNLAPEQVDEALMKRATWDEEPLPIVRQMLLNVLPEVRARISLKVVREIAARALHYRLDARPPALAAAEGGKRVTQGITLEQSWVEHVQRVDLPPGMGNEPLRDLGLKLMKEVEEREAPAPEA